MKCHYIRWFQKKMLFLKHYCVVSMTVGYILDTSLVTLLTSHIALSLTSHHRWGCDQGTRLRCHTVPLAMASWHQVSGSHILSPAMTEHYWDLLLSSVSLSLETVLTVNTEVRYQVTTLSSVSTVSLASFSCQLSIAS